MADFAIYVNWRVKRGEMARANIKWLHSKDSMEVSRLHGCPPNSNLSLTRPHQTTVDYKLINMYLLIPIHRKFLLVTCCYAHNKFELKEIGKNILRRINRKRLQEWKNFYVFLIVPLLLSGRKSLYLTFYLFNHKFSVPFLLYDDIF
jgi:hypothetical protein